MNKKKYLHIQTFDYDLLHSLVVTSFVLKNVFDLCHYYPSQNELLYYREMIKNLWYAIHFSLALNSDDEFNLQQISETEEWFDPVMSIVEKENIVKTDTNSSVYIPMFHTKNKPITPFNKNFDN